MPLQARKRELGHIHIHVTLTKFEPAGWPAGAPSRVIDKSEICVTTNDPASGRSAALRRPSTGRRFRILCCALLCTTALPALADEPATPATASVAAAAQAMPAAALASPAMIDPMPLPDRALMFAGDINRLLASQSASPTPAATSGRIQTVLKRALALLGTPYRWGGTSPERGFDCSGLVGYVFRTTLGIELPRVSRDMAKEGELVDRSHMSPGDLVFFGRKGRVNHVGIYLGDSRFVHAPRTGRDVTVSTMDGGYWGNKFVEARRVAGI